MKSDLTIRSVIKHFIEGLGIIRAMEAVGETFGMTAVQWDCVDDEELIDRFLDMLPFNLRVNPDHFYTAMYIGLANGFDLSFGGGRELVEQLMTKAYPTELFEAGHNKFKRNCLLLDNFRQLADDFSVLSDAELKSAVTTQFQVSFQSLLATEQCKNFIFTKINHGYWEHFLCIYAQSFEARSTRDEFRKLEKSIFDSSYSASGMDAALGILIQSSLSTNTWKCGGDTEGVLRLAINYSAGDRTVFETLNTPLSPVSRAAMAGSLAFFSGVMGNAPISLGDGAEAKKLLDYRELKIFAKRFINDAPAVLFVVPPHLKDIVVPGMIGQVYKMVIPRKFAHETWRITLPVFISLVKQIVNKHGKLSILAQSAVLAPILGLSLTRIFNDKDGDLSVRFFDLGRVLDVASPETTAWQPWFKPYAEIPIDELSPFKLSSRPSAQKLLYAEPK
jgi:hypothetical protein